MEEIYLVKATMGLALVEPVMEASAAQLVRLRSMVGQSRQQILATELQSEVVQTSMARDR